MDEPFYVGFEIGGFELGLVPDLQPGEVGAKALWGVDDLEKEIERLRDLGVTIKGEIEEVGGGIKVMDLADPVQRQPSGPADNSSADLPLGRR